MSRLTRSLSSLLGSLRNHDDNVEDNVDFKIMNLYFTYEPRDTFKSFVSSLTVKIISKLDMEHSVKFEIEI